jgi:hypothetical protein
MKNITLIDSKRARLQMCALDAIYSGTQWLTAEQLDAARMDPAVHGTGAICQLQISEQLFSIRRDGRYVFPRYAFGNDFRPLPVMSDIMKTFHGWDPMMIAGWLESTSSFLQGRRPRELIASDPILVLQAAKDAVMHLSQY